MLGFTASAKPAGLDVTDAPLPPAPRADDEELLVSTASSVQQKDDRLSYRLYFRAYLSR